MFNSLFKLGLYFSLLGETRLDPMVFELINHERRLREAEADDKAAAKTQEPEKEEIRRAA